jgi:hypothetical protein
LPGKLFAVNFLSIFLTGKDIPYSPFSDKDKFRFIRLMSTLVKGGFKDSRVRVKGLKTEESTLDPLNPRTLGPLFISIPPA